MPKRGIVINVEAWKIAKPALSLSMDSIPIDWYFLVLIT